MMIRMKNIRLRHYLGRTLLTIAYMALVFEWLWLVIIGLPPVIESGLFDALSMPVESSQTRPEPQSDSSPVMIAAVGAMTVIILIVTTVILVKLPHTIMKGGDVIMTQVAEKTLPVITHHKTLPPKKRRELSRRLRLLFELIVSVIPFALLPFTPAPEGLTQSMVLTVGGFLGGIALVSFATAWLAEPKVSTSRTRSRASRG